MARETLISAVDIGSSTVRVASAILRADGGMRLVALSHSPTLGVRRGQIIDIDEVASCLRIVLDDAEKQSGYHISRATCLVSGPQTEITRSIGRVAVSRADGEVSREDTERVAESARGTTLPQNKDIIHTVPLSYTLDEETQIEDPVGMKGVRLEIDALLVLASSPVLRALTKTFQEARIQPEGWMFGPLAVSCATLSKKQKEVGVAIVNIGGATTTVSVFYEGRLHSSHVVSLGGVHITYDIAIGLKSTLDIAEQVKLEYGHANSARVSKREQVVMNEWGMEDVVVSRYALSRICEARMRDILGEVKKELKPHLRRTALPGGVVLTGGAAGMPGVKEVAERELKLPVHKGIIRGVESESHDMRDLGFCAAIGAVLTSRNDSLRTSGPPLSLILDQSNLSRRLKGWIQEFLP